MSGNRECIAAALAHRESDRVPYNFVFTPPAKRKLERHFGTAALEDALGLPMRMSKPTSIKPLYAPPAEFGPTVSDEFGVVWSTNELDRGSPVGPCLAEADLNGYTFPDPAAAYRFEALDAWCQRQRDHFTVIWVGDLWERATFMRGMEHMLMDLALHPRFVDGLLRRLADYILGTMEILFARFAFDAVALSDDYGGQRSLLMSPTAWRRHLRPLLAEIYGAAKRHGRIVFHHSCGNILPVIRDMIDVGLDILHPIQPEAMDIFQLKREFGRDLTFCGGLRTQDMLPRGTPAQVRDDVRRLKSVMGEGGGFILEPGITLQDDVPLANMLAMIDEARRPR